MGRTNDIPVLSPEDAAAVIRTAFGLKGWQAHARSAFKVSTVVSALWVARRECGSERMQDVIRWANQMRGKMR